MTDNRSPARVLVMLPPLGWALVLGAFVLMAAYVVGQPGADSMVTGLRVFLLPIAVLLLLLATQTTRAVARRRPGGAWLTALIGLGVGMPFLMVFVVQGYWWFGALAGVHLALAATAMHTARRWEQECRPGFARPQGCGIDGDRAGDYGAPPATRAPRRATSAE